MQTAAKALAPDEIPQVAERLQRAYPYIAARKAAEGVLTDRPLGALIRAILSQNTTDCNRDVAYHALRARFPSWDAASQTTHEELAEIISATNHAYTKAGRILDILRELRAEHGTATLDFLRRWPTRRVVDYLQRFTGVGPKSAAIVALFSLKRPVMPVDTHVFRVTRRLGWISPTTNEERAHTELQQLIPPDLVFALHTSLWEHGHVTCRPRPICRQCAVYAFCIYAEKTAPEPPLEEAIAITSGGIARAA